jgi:diaminopimelate decarboxylase
LLGLIGYVGSGVREREKEAELEDLKLEAISYCGYQWKLVDLGGGVGVKVGRSRGE